MKTAVIDIDGTLVYFSPTEDGHIGGVVIGAKEALIRLKQLGFRIHLYTSRPLEEKESLAAKLKSLGFIFDDLTCGKPDGVVYIDNKAVRFRGDWNAALSWVRREVRN